MCSTVIKVNIMAGLRPSRIDRMVNRPNYTRREYVRAVPGIKVVHFDMGELGRKFPYEVYLESKNACQIRTNAMEASRIAANRYLMKALGKTAFHYKIRTIPFQIIRENAMASGKKADRYGNGMRLSFGKPIGTAARVDRGQRIMSVWVEKEGIEAARIALRKAAMKLPTTVKIDVQERSN
ncbi:MAG: 50S ribosomal protein L10e [Candidatus Methanofastidiosum methylothiophilum]|uniref:Large ribosomal subunit protein uL16 n=2 Tax=Candidatus Methanofastidiosum methylothiophilum TaxID=1705564 RepID=A0A150IVB2_9EURY|nr:MAG: 50S ribosomal protein L10e [Candidatus Methanofastidiosum methylthiophilus]